MKISVTPFKDCLPATVNAADRALGDFVQIIHVVGSPSPPPSILGG